MAKRSKRKKSRSFLNILSLVVACIMFYGSMSSLFEEREPYDPVPEYEIAETVQYILVGDSLVPDTMIVHNRYWENYYDFGFEGSAKVLISEVRAANKHKDELPIITYTEADWESLYRAIADFEGSELDLVVSMLDSIRTDLTLSMYDFADVIVCFVQDIPYSYILRHNCEERYMEDASFRDMIDDGTECYDDISYGVNTPAEFIGSLHGDCDTRTVLLYKLMSHFGYDVAILGSVFYRHSILGINMPGAGDYIKFRGKKYYVWETTGTGWIRGEIPPDNSTLSYWEVNLVNQMY